MASTPLPTPPLPGVPEANRWPLRISSVPAEPRREPPDSVAIFRTLRLAVASNGYAPDIILGAVAEAAQALTGASAAAVAMRRDGVVVCCGRSGEMAPDLGARLSVDSGISGECLRSGRTLRCDDTQSDYRADPELCRRLGLRSIAAVPLRDRQGVSGILETFSTRPYAFADEHVDVLLQLADLAEAAQGSTTYPPTPIEIEPQRMFSIPATETLPLSQEIIVPDTTVPETGHQLSSGTRRYWIGGGVVAVLLLLIAGWEAWSTPASQPAARAVPASQGNVVEPAAPTIGTALVWKPSPARARDRSIAASPASVLPSASRVEGGPINSPPPVEAAGEHKPPADVEASPEAPRVAETSAGHASLGNFLPGSHTVPEFSGPVSQGVTDGFLIHKVQPIYPPQALPMRLEGPVVLEATITEEGNVQDLSVVSGNPTLARAALDAVRQWQYRPYLLNGKPVRMPTQITVTFKVP